MDLWPGVGVVQEILALKEELEISRQRAYFTPSRSRLR